jgi:hypothetical protein
MTDHRHTTIEEAGHCSTCQPELRHDLEYICGIDQTPYWWLSFVDRVEDVAVHQGVAIVPAYDMGQAVEAAWATGCNPGGEVMGSQLDREDVERADVPTCVLLDGVELAAVKEALRITHEGGANE